MAAVVTISAAALVGISILPDSNRADAAPTLADAERTLNTLGSELNKVNEQYNNAAVLLAASRAKHAALLVEIKPLQAKADAFQQRVGLIGADAYRGGRPNMFTAFANGDSPQTVIERLSVLDQLGSDQQGVIEALKKAKKPVEDVERKLNAEIATQAAQEKVLRDRKAKLTTDMAKWTALKAQLKSRASRTTPRPPPPVYDGAASGRAAVVVKYAYAQIGKPYVFGGAGPNSFDCSGLTLAAWAKAGVKGMPHSSRQQYNKYPKVPKAQMQPGDLIGLYSDLHHIGIYVGGGYMIHSPQPGQDVEKVSINTSYWQGIFRGAVRPS